MGVSYFVRYQGLGDNGALFDDYYTHKHAPILLDFPGLQGLTLYRPSPAADSFPVNRDGTDFLAQMDFPDEMALHAALASEARARARADFANLPVGDARVTHLAMTARRMR